MAKIKQNGKAIKRKGAFIWQNKGICPDIVCSESRETVDYIH